VFGGRVSREGEAPAEPHGLRRLGGSLALPAPIRDFIRKPLDPHPAVPATFPRWEKDDCGATIPRSALAPVNPNFSSAQGKAPTGPAASAGLGGSLALPAPFQRRVRNPGRLASSLVGDPLDAVFSAQFVDQGGDVGG